MATQPLRPVIVRNNQHYCVRMRVCKCAASAECARSSSCQKRGIWADSFSPEKGSPYRGQAQ